MYRACVAKSTTARRDARTACPSHLFLARMNKGLRCNCRGTRTIATLRDGAWPLAHGQTGAFMQVRPAYVAVRTAQRRDTPSSHSAAVGGRLIGAMAMRSIALAGRSTTACLSPPPPGHRGAVPTTSSPTRWGTFGVPPQATFPALYERTTVNVRDDRLQCAEVRRGGRAG